MEMGGGFRTRSTLLRAKFESATIGNARPSFQKSHEARFDFVDRADQFHALFELAFLP
jgi:hypothetical protein